MIIELFICIYVAVWIVHSVNLHKMSSLTVALLFESLVNKVIFG